MNPRIRNVVLMILRYMSKHYVARKVCDSGSIFSLETAHRFDKKAGLLYCLCLHIQAAKNLPLLWCLYGCRIINQVHQWPRFSNWEASSKFWILKIWLTYTTAWLEIPSGPADYMSQSMMCIFIRTTETHTRYGLRYSCLQTDHAIQD
jgi:hypothetical protein